ncbi:MAG: phosphoribosylamine--glycine ligase [Deltaproteobacteria bacterium]|nr:phosphoribosylamine--glycine ligase [Deltaproteobacteria bacterium]
MARSLHIAVIGAGGRELALQQRLQAEGHRVLPLAVPAGDLDRFSGDLAAQSVDLAVIGPEAPLVAGLADALRKAGVAAVGPGKAAARLEGSKSLAKGFMGRHGVATAPWQVLALGRAVQTADQVPLPVVVKRDGLCGGKGVNLCRDRQQLRAALEVAVLADGPEAPVVLEELLHGRELSLHALVSDGECCLLPAAMDHKRLLDGDLGPNTGGMGAVAPVPWVTPAVLASIRTAIVEPTLRGLREEHLDYRGILYFGLMLTAAGPRLLEYNVRLGDPECQVLLPLLATDLGRLLHSVANGSLPTASPPLHPGFAAAVVLAAPGYPLAPQLGRAVEVANPEGLLLAGLYTTPEGLQTSAGRAAVAVGHGSTLEQALRQAYDRAEPLAAQGLCLRRDIGSKARPLRLAVLASGRGSNLAALLRACDQGVLQGLAQVVVTLWDRAAPGQALAQAAGVAVAQLDHSGLTRGEWGERAAALLRQHGVEVVVLAGFARILAPEFVDAFAGRIVNIHPADPTQYVGLHSYRWAWEQGLAATAVTVHLVEAGLDSGPILAQEGVDLRGAATLVEVEARGLAVEHRLYAQAIRNWLLAL